MSDSQSSKPKRVGTHIGNKQDQDILTRKHFEVNMRLMKESNSYKKIILDICEMMRRRCLPKENTHKPAKGIAGANIGMPFKIIAVCFENDCRIMLNPVITKYYGRAVLTKTNCGSVQLRRRITVKRSEFIDIEYYDLDGTLMQWKGIGPEPGYTIQHEVDHCNGVLILDRQEQQSAAEA